MKHFFISFFLLSNLTTQALQPKKITTRFYSCYDSGTPKERLSNSGKTVEHFDSLGNLIHTVNEGGGAINLSYDTYFLYNENGHKAQDSVVANEKIILDNYSYGDNQQLARTIHFNKNDDDKNSLNCRVDSLFYEEGKLVKRSHYFCNGIESSFTTYEYDEVGLLVQEKFVDNKVISWKGNLHSGNVLGSIEKVQDSVLIKTTSYSYVDAVLFGKSVKEETKERETVTLYNTDGLIISESTFVQGEASGVSKFLYNEHGHLIRWDMHSASRENNSTVTYEYSYIPHLPHWTEKTQFSNGKKTFFWKRDFSFYHE